jgi:hypothetical protein
MICDRCRGRWQSAENGRPHKTATKHVGVDQNRLSRDISTSFDFYSCNTIVPSDAGIDVELKENRYVGRSRKAFKTETKVLMTSPWFGALVFINFGERSPAT